MKKESVIKSCYSALNNLTPLYTDCGKICNRKCCKGDEKTGMLLFPGEEKLLDDDIKIIEGEDNRKIAVCKGSCNRRKRPLSCRIYPFFPLIKKDEKGREYIEVSFDVRGSCPISSGKYTVNKAFLRKVKRVGKYLLLNEETEKVYREASKEAEECIELRDMLK